MSHPVDVPITDLDADDDDGLSSISDLDTNVLRDDFALDNNGTQYFQGDSLFTRLKQSILKLASRGGYYSKVPKSFATNGIELRNRRFTDADSFDLSDEEFIIRRQSDGLFQKLLSTVKNYTLYSMLFIFLIIIIVLSILLSSKNSSSSSRSKKPLLSNGTHVFHPTTILISLDGFHPHYISKDLTPNLHDLFINGYGPPYMIPSFPSSTFPNHWSIVTGLYPENHGIVGNTFFDPILNKQFINVIPEKSLDPLWWGGEPIWSTAEFNGVRSAIHMYPGSEVKFQNGGDPSEVDKYNGTESLEVKFERIINWVDRDINTRPELILSYLPTIDSLGHKFGVHGKELEQGLTKVDSFIGDIRNSIESRNLTDIINFIIVSDHGMSPTSSERLVYLDDLLNITKIQHVDGWPLFGLRPFPDFSVDEVYNELLLNFKENSGYNIYLKEEIPERFHFGGDINDGNKQYYERIAPIWVIPDIGYSITTHDDMERKKGVYSPKGVHGYDNSEMLMRSIFLSQGPFFKSKFEDENDNKLGKKVKPFQNVEVYNILCDTLGLKPVKNNGNDNIFHKGNHLLQNWNDELLYPNLNFDIDFIEVDSTYDILFRKKAKETITLEPETELTSTSEVTETDAQDENNKEDAKQGDKQEEKQEEKQQDKQEAGQQEQQENKQDSQEDDKNEGAKDEGKDENENEDESLWDMLEDAIDDISEELEDFGNDFKDQLDEWIEDVEDAFDSNFNNLFFL